MMEENNLCLNMLLNSTKCKNVGSVSNVGRNSESLWKVWKQFESNVLKNQIILSNFNEFVEFLQSRILTIIPEFEKYILRKSD